MGLTVLRYDPPDEMCMMKAGTPQSPTCEAMADIDVDFIAVYAELAMCVIDGSTVLENDGGAVELSVFGAVLLVLSALFAL